MANIADVCRLAPVLVLGFALGHSAGTDGAST
jgi:hypothetical protein